MNPWRQRPFWVAVLASSIVFGDVQILNLALNSIESTYGVTTQQVQLIAIASLLPIAAGVLLAGHAVDRFGRRQMLATGILLFTAASLHWLVESFPVHLVGRLVQGVGLSLIIPASQAILSAHFTGEHKSLATSRWVVVTTAISVALPPLAGVALDAASWRWVVFYGPVLALVVFALLPTLAPQPRPAPHRVHGASAFLFVTGMFLLTLGVTNLRQGILPGAWSLPMILLGAALLASVVLMSYRLEDPMIPVHLWEIPTLGTANILTMLAFGGSAVVAVVFPLYLTQQLGWTYAQAGALSIPYYALITLLAPFARGLYARQGFLSLVVGFFGLALGYVLIAVYPFVPVQLGVAGWILASMGMGFPATCLTAAVLDAAPESGTGRASALNSTSARTGQLLFVALLGSLYAQTGSLRGVMGILAVLSTVGLLLSLRTWRQGHHASAS